MKLPRSLIKKYGISKKAWSVFKNKKTRRSVNVMPRKKHFGRSKGKGSGLTPTQAVIGGIAYGFARNKISSMVRGFMPGTLGNISDEILMGAIAFLAASKGTGIIKDAGKIGLGIETGRLTQNFSLGSATASSTSSSSNGATFT